MTLTPDQKKVYKSLLESQTNSADLHNLLKKFKDDNKDSIRLSGSKGDLINNIIDNVEKDVIAIFEVQALIKDSEEFGDQHIFIYKLKDKSKIDYYNNTVSLFDKIVPSHLRTSFPRLMDLPTSIELADFRFPNRGLSNSFLIKYYDLKKREIKEDEDVDVVNLKRTVVYRTIQSRMVYTVDWDGKDEIEVKITRTSFDSRKGLNESLKLIKNLIYAGGNGILLDRDFILADLESGINNLIINSRANPHIYKIIYTTFVDSSGGRTIIHSEDDTGKDDIFSEPSRRESIEACLNGNAKGINLSIRFLESGSNEVLENDVNIFVGRNSINHLLVAAKIKPQEYKYVRRQIELYNQVLP